MHNKLRQAATLFLTAPSSCLPFFLLRLLCMFALLLAQRQQAQGGGC